MAMVQKTIWLDEESLNKYQALYESENVKKYLEEHGERQNAGWFAFLRLALDTALPVLQAKFQGGNYGKTQSNLL